MKPTHILGQPLPRQIVVVRALRGLGDLLCITPALRALRIALPSAQVSLVGLPEARPFVARNQQYLDELIDFPGYPGIAERAPDLVRWPAFLAGMHERRFDLALQMHGNGTLMNPFTVLLGARMNAGFFVPSQYCPDPQRFLTYVDHESEIRRYLRLLDFLGIPAQGEDLEFAILNEDRLALDAIAAARELSPGGYVCVHPGAHENARRWSPECFAAVADALAAQGLRVVLTGSAQEADLVIAVASAMRAPALDLCGETSLGALAALLAGARLLVCNDTGVSHLAAAVRTPSVVVFLASDPRRWAPLNQEHHRIVRSANPLDSSKSVIDEAFALLGLEREHVA